MITDFGDVGDFERPPLHSGEAVKLWRASKKGPTAAAEDVAKKFFCSVDEVCDAIVTVFTEESRNGPNQRMRADYLNGTYYAKNIRKVIARRSVKENT